MGPNEGKTLLGIIECVARALMVANPQNLERDYARAELEYKYTKEHGRGMHAERGWYKKISYDDPKPWYYYIGDGRGRSGRKLPKGAKIIATVNVQPRKITVFEKLEKDIQLMSETLMEYIKIIRDNALREEVKYSPFFIENRMFPYPFNINYCYNKIQDLRKTLIACDPHFNEDKIETFRDSLRKIPNIIPPIEKREKYPPGFVYVQRKDLLSFRDHLIEEHNKFGVDGVLMGCIYAIEDICYQCANVVPTIENQGRIVLPKQDWYKTLSNDEKRLYWYRVLSYFLTSGKEKKPQNILARTVYRAIEAGFTAELIKILNEYREYASNKIEEALESETVDKSLNRLYEAMPFALAAHFLCGLLYECRRYLDDKQRTYIIGARRNVEEIGAKIGHPFATQLQDFNGDYWRSKKKRAKEIAKEGGKQAAEEAVSNFIESYLSYPRKYIPDLLK